MKKADEPFFDVLTVFVILLILFAVVGALAIVLVISGYRFEPRDCRVKTQTINLNAMEGSRAYGLDEEKLNFEYLCDCEIENHGRGVLFNYNFEPCTCIVKWNECRSQGCWND